jgi:asparagine synthase (glutamine-hydrolysing)
MCGIAGIISHGRVIEDDAPIHRMTAAIAHRGPDGDGHYVRENVALGHRRLAIIDPAAGKQPMANEDETVWVTFNGEIYNFAELRRQLEGYGHRFKTRCDTEVIVHAFEQWGDECVRRFRGMFAFCVVDFRSRKGLLARDPFGIKPVFYQAAEGQLTFASELSALRVAGVPLTINLRAIELFLRLQYIPSPETIYSDVMKLPPAHYISFDLDGNVASPVRYWDWKVTPGRDRTDAEWQEEFQHTFHDSVNAHLVSDVPFGVFLSGGIDSTLVALEMSRILARPIKGFCIAFDEKEYSELQYAKAAAARIGFPLEVDYVRNDFWDDLPTLINHYGEPFGDSSAVPTWAVSKLARQHVPMVLSGDGGDELFGGYYSYGHWLQPYIPLAWARWKHAQSKVNARGLTWSLARKYLGSNWNELIEWQRIIQYTTWTQRHQIWKPEFHHLIKAPTELFEQAHEEVRDSDALGYVQAMDQRTYLPGAILTKVDIASMYHGLEVRPPILDTRVAAFASRLPKRLRMHKNGDGKMHSKILLKRTLEKVFPKEFVHRRKMGFGIPRDRWLMPGEPGRRLLEDVVLSSDSPLRQWFNMAPIEQLLAVHAPGDNDKSNILWLVLVLGLWARQNSDLVAA